MAEIPQFKEEYPLLNKQNVASGAESYEAFAKTLGAISQGAVKEVEKIEESKSNAMYLSSVANVDQLALSAQEAILTDPANAAKHAQTARDSLEKVKSIAYVNDADRAKLDRYADKTANSTELDAVKAEVKQSQIGASFEHYKNWPSQLNAFKDLLATGTPKQIESYQESLTKHLQTLVLTGSLTALQAGAAFQSMSSMVDVAKDFHDLVNNPELHTPQNYHAVMSNPLDKDKTKNINYPADETTRFLIDHHSSDRTFQGAMDSLQQHRFADMRTYENMTVNQRLQYKLSINGMRKADGLIDSNAPMPTILARLNELKYRDDYASTSEKRALNSYVNDVENGNSQKLMARTTYGGQIVRNYSDQMAFFNNKLQNTDPENTEEIKSINEGIAQSKNQYVNNGVAYAEAHHWPNYHVIPSQDLAVVSNGFNVGEGNAMAAYNTFKQYSPQNKLQFASEIKDPQQRAVLQTLAMAGSGQTEQEQIDFITANQKGRKYTEIDLHTQDKISDDYLKNQINTQIINATNIIRAQNTADESTILNENLIRSGINYAKFLSEKNGQFTMEKDSMSTYGSIQNVRSVANFINKSYEPMSGTNYIVNKKQINLEKETMDYVANYAIQKGWEGLSKRVGEATLIQLKSQAPLMATVLPNNILVAKDPNGNVLFRAPLSSEVISAAKLNARKVKEEKAKVIKKLEKKTKTFTDYLSPEEQLLKLNVGEGNVD